ITGYRSHGKQVLMVISIVAILFGLFHLYTAFFGVFTALRQRGIHLAFALIICFLKFAANRNKGATKEPFGPYVFLGIGIWATIYSILNAKKINMPIVLVITAIILTVGFSAAWYFTRKMRKTYNEEIEERFYWYDIIFIITGVIGCLYIAINANSILSRVGTFTLVDMILGVWILICVLEAARRAVGPILMFIGVGMLLYCKLGGAGLFFHPGFSLSMIIRKFILIDAGLWSTPLGVSSTFIAMFLLLGAAIQTTGLSDVLMKVAKGIFGAMVGGPAKMAVIASSMFSMISGSSTSNVAFSGPITIPLMKRSGIPGSLAAGVEASASLGGQITPPIMGSAAFIMAEFLGISYLKIVVAAILPSILYYTGVYTMVHFETKKIGAKGLPKSEIPAWKKDALTKGYLFLPLVILVLLLVKNFSPLSAALYAFLSCLALSIFDKNTRITPKKFLKILDSAGQTLTVVAIPCAVAGLVVGTAAITGLTPALTVFLTGLSKNNLILTLVLTMLMCLVLGLGVPTTANYIIMTIMTVPIMVKVGVMPLAAHLFCFYFGIMSEITPPVAITSYTASAIGGTSFWMTTFHATRLAAVVYIVPFIFVFNTSMLLGTEKLTVSIVIVVITAVIGAICFAIGMAGFIRRKMFAIERIILCGGAVLLIKPGTFSDWIGLVIILFIFAMQWIYKKNPKNYRPSIQQDSVKQE
ncbi:MAG: TRAP transporter fused permease subunit, partial [Spirochaetaceae bacterium]|nr:TRAP transporter fused permease subunit [Spirochaetaceae bacterium]